jgi:hypothetical protein
MAGSSAFSRKLGTAIALLALAMFREGAAQEPDDNAIARLARQIERGETTLEYRTNTGYLPALLERLHVNPDSQVLVFSKTSFQQSLISPRNPRALYFNDSVAVGTVPGGGVFELVAADAKAGLAFYTLDARQAERPRFERRGVECLFCHSPGNKGAPALIVASVVPDASGLPAYTGAFIKSIDHRTAFEERWGGWYVTGTHGSQKHLGNAVAPDPERPFDLQQAGTQNLTTLADRIDVAKYLNSWSDIVALMTLEHQVGMTNRLNAISVQYRLAERAGLATDTDLRRLDQEIDALVTYMLFVDEPSLVEPVNGVSTFTRTFPKQGPRDQGGRSLRDFDLQKRLFRYPLSYMIYSDLFDAMPARVRERVYRRLYDVLTGAEKSRTYAALSAADRQSVLEILIDTKTNLPDYWKASSTQ